MIEEDEVEYEGEEVKAPSSHAMMLEESEARASVTQLLMKKR